MPYRIDPNDGVTRADLDSVKLYLPKIETALVSSQVFSLDVDANQNTPPEEKAGTWAEIYVRCAPLASSSRLRVFAPFPAV